MSAISELTSTPPLSNTVAATGPLPLDNRSRKPRNNNTLRVISSNVDSLTNKLLNIQVLLKDEEADIAGLVEILPKFTTIPVTKSMLQISGFQCFTNLGQPNCRRGVGIYVREGFQVSLINPLIYDVPWVESLWLDITLQENKKICIGCVYRSPSAPSLNGCEIHLKTIIDGIYSII